MALLDLLRRREYLNALFPALPSLTSPSVPQAISRRYVPCRRGGRSSSLMSTHRECSTAFSRPTMSWRRVCSVRRRMIACRYPEGASAASFSRVLANDVRSFRGGSYYSGQEPSATFGGHLPSHAHLSECRLCVEGPLSHASGSYGQKLEEEGGRACSITARRT
jgi:hypothetical protein